MISDAEGTIIALYLLRALPSNAIVEHFTPHGQNSTLQLSGGLQHLMLGSLVD